MFKKASLSVLNQRSLGCLFLRDKIIINTWVDVDNNKKGVTIEPVEDYGFPIDVYLDDFKKQLDNE